MAPSPAVAVANEVAEGPAEDIIKKDGKRKWVGYIWDTFDKPPEERKFLFKLDAALLTYASLGQYYRFPIDLFQLTWC